MFDSSSNSFLLYVRSTLNALGVLSGVPSCTGSAGGSAVSFETYSGVGDGVTTGLLVQADPPCSPGARGPGSNALLFVLLNYNSFKIRWFLIVTLPKPYILILYCRKGKTSTILPVQFHLPFS